MELDNIINNLVDKANDQKNGKRIERPKSTLNPGKHVPPRPAYLENDENEGEQPYFDKETFEVREEEQEYEGQEKGPFNNFLSLNTIIFEKSTEQLLSMKYLPL